MQITLHQTKHSIADFSAIFSYLKHKFAPENIQDGLHVFPELYLTGYPLQDLCLNRSFISSYLDFLDQFNQWSKSSFPSPLEDTCILLGGLSYEFETDGIPQFIKNVIYRWTPGKTLECLYTKCLLPNYDIFDEKKYFTPGEKCGVLEFQNKKIGLLVCEDMWWNTSYPMDPVEELKNQGELDLIVNLSASPWHLQKNQKREKRAKDISHTLGCPFAYVNRVGGEDEILFDGNSFFVDQDRVLEKGKRYQADELSFPLPSTTSSKTLREKSATQIGTWGDLFAPRIDFDGHLPRLETLSDQDCFDLIQGIGFGISEYANKCGFKKYLVALSGGLDSALVLALLKLTQDPEREIEAIYMPSKYSSGLSYDLSAALCKSLGIKLHYLPIKFVHSVIQNSFESDLGAPLEGLANENIQSRLRGAYIYARSNQTGAMVLNTSNKSELSVGYSTLYGDSVGALSVLGDLYKTEVYALASYINRDSEIIPKGIIDRPPTAELREDQQDTDSLPPYSRLDAMLELILSNRFDSHDLLKLGFEYEEVVKTYQLYRSAEFKRFQFCPIIKLKSKSYGFGYRTPTCKDSNFYF